MDSSLSEIVKVPTGIAGFDEIVLGGLPKGRTTLASGTTGTGKTLLAVEFLVRGIEKFDEPGVFVTFEESPADIRRNAASLGMNIEQWEAEGKWLFLDASSVMPGDDDEVIVGSYDFGGLVARMNRAVAKVHAARVSVDSLGAVFRRFADAAVVRGELRRVASALRELGVTTMMTAERTEEYGPISRFEVEEFISDNVIVLRNVLEQEKRRRTIEVLKLRGAPHRSGECMFTIDPAAGIVVLPLSVIGPLAKASSERVTTGVAELDLMCGGGLYRDAIAFATGPTGTGKTLIAAHFIAGGVRAGERCALFSFEESRDQLLRNAGTWGLDLEGMESSGQLLLVCNYPERSSLEDHYLGVTHAIEGFAPSRLAVDNLSALERVATRRGIRDIVIGLGSLVRQHEITAMLTATPGLTPDASAAEVHLTALADTIIGLHYVELESEMHRSIAIVKQRGSAHDRAVREFMIDHEGMHIGERLLAANWPVQEAGLTGSHSGLPADAPAEHPERP